MATSCVLFWFNSILRTVYYLSCLWTGQFDRTEILDSSGFSVTFCAEGHDKRDTAFRQTFIEPWLIVLEFKISRVKWFKFQIHGVFPAGGKVHTVLLAADITTHSFPFYRCPFILSPNTATLPHRKPASNTKSCAISQAQTQYNGHSAA